MKAEALAFNAAVGFVNPRATQHNPAQSGDKIAITFGVPGLPTITEPAQPEHIREYADPNKTTLIFSKGGDHTARQVIAAMIGCTPDNANPDPRYIEQHAALAERMVYVPLANGNGNLLPLSALGKYAKKPDLIEEATDLEARRFRPLTYRIYRQQDESTKEVQSGIITSCIGVKLSAEVANELELRRDELKRYRRPMRLALEFVQAMRSAWKAKPMVTQIEYHDGNPAAQPTVRTPFESTGIELITSKRYAKLGRTRVNIDDPYQQVVWAEHEPKKRKRLAAIAKNLFRLATGRYKGMPVLDFSHPNSTFRITVESDQAVPFHVDGDVADSQGTPYRLEPGDTLEIAPARLAVWVLMQQPKSRRRLALAA